MRWRLTFNFEQTEEKAKQFCENIYNYVYTDYARRKFEKPHTYYVQNKDASGAWIVWYRELR